DDEAAIEAAEAYFKNASNAEKLEQSEVRNEPPPAPRNQDGSPSFPVTLPNEPPHTYSWVELGKSELYSLKLNSQALEANPALEAEVEKRRKNRETFPLPGVGGGILYTRTITDWGRRRIRDRELGKRHEFFVLARDPLPGAEITGDYLVSAREGVSRDDERR